MTQPSPNFEDHFSGRARDYARFRPSYPGELFAFLAGRSPHRRLAWDCGTGSGQAALGLADFFERVVATDASAEQLAHAFPHPRVEYRAEPAESVSLVDGSAALVTVAVAVHWFEFEPFYHEVRRVLAPGGLLAVWTYHLPVIDPAVDRLLAEYYTGVLGGYWPERIRYLEARYRTLPFPFEELEPPAFESAARWDLPRLLGFLDSWSAARRFEAERGYHPLKELWDELAAAWGPAGRERLIRWPLHLRLGRVPPP